jgi:hypothetical protein
VLRSVTGYWLLLMNVQAVVTMSSCTYYAQALYGRLIKDLLPSAH